LLELMMGLEPMTFYRISANLNAPNPVKTGFGVSFEALCEPQERIFV